MKKALAAASLYALPFVAFAQTPNNLTGIIGFAGDLLNRLIPVLIALALVIFFIGLIQYIWKRKGGKDIMIAGLVGLFIMVSVWGIIRLAQNTLFGGRSTATPDVIPQVPQRN